MIVYESQTLYAELHKWSDVTEYASSVCHPTHAECITSPSNLMP